MAIEDINTNGKISFRLKTGSSSGVPDPNEYVGVVQANNVSSHVARTFSDIDADQLRLGYDTADTDNQMYLILRIVTGVDAGADRAFALNWIDTYEELTSTNKAQILIEGVTAEQVRSAVSILQNYGYIASVASVEPM